MRETYSSLCAFAVIDDEADTLSSAPPPFQYFLDSPLLDIIIGIIVIVRLPAAANIYLLSHRTQST